MTLLITSTAVPEVQGLAAAVPTVAVADDERHTMVATRLLAVAFTAQLP